MRAYLSLGSNLDSLVGGRAETVKAAADAIARLPGLVELRRSRTYRTAAVGFGPQPDFANLVLEVQTELGPELLVAIGLDLERDFGRISGPRFGPRALDVDLLLCDRSVTTSAACTVPHPRMHQRRFVLVPLAELAPDLRHPVLKRTIVELLNRVDDRGRVEPWHEDVADRAVVGRERMAAR